MGIVVPTQLPEEMFAMNVSANNGDAQTLHFFMLQLYVSLGSVFNFNLSDSWLGLRKDHVLT